VCTGLLVEKSNEICLSAPTIVCLWFLAALGEELDGWVGRNALVFGSGLRILGFGVNLCNKNVGLVCEICGNGLPYWSKGLAV
jgi:hypothetical protein